tara:strand:+ start:2849 stop:3811 length:963 start_codon:yes stop_codon:yes gene_type:complete
MEKFKKFNLNQTHEMKYFFEKYGYLHIKNVYKKEELLEYLEKDINKADISKDLTCYPNLNKLINNKKLISTMNYVLGGNLQYCFDSSLNVNMKTDQKYPFYKLLHRDNQDGFDLNSYFPVIRCGVYFHDFTKFSGGPKIAISSHKNEFFFLNIGLTKLIKFILRLSDFGCKYIYQKRTNQNNCIDPNHNKYPHKINIKNIKIFPKYVNMYPEIGDLILWNLRAYHQGYAKKLKYFPSICLSALYERFLPNFLFEKKITNRKAAFFVLLGNTTLTNEYVENRIKYINKDHWNFLPNKKILNELKEKGLKCITLGYDKNQFS